MNHFYQQAENPFLLKYQLVFSYIFLAISIILFFNIDHDLWSIIQKSISDAYIQVTSFVAGTLLLFYSLEKFLKVDIGLVLQKNRKLEVFLSSFLGSLPGCGGSIIVLTQYIRGKVSFGSVVATLTATMGDAAFLLIAKEPLTGLSIMLVGFVVGSISGLLVNFLHGKYFLKITGCDVIKSRLNSDKYKVSRKLDTLWMCLIIPGFIIGVLTAFQFDLDLIFKNDFIEKPITFYGFIAGSLCFIMWMLPLLSGYKYQPSTNQESIIRRTVSDTNFITGWVILAFLTFELTVYFSNVNLSVIFQSYVYLIPLIAILIGFLPGCGPQVLVTTMYLGGFIPLSAQLGNAIANDGDALFPAIALHPKAALVATLYSAIPALIISYLYLFLFEMNF